MCNFSKRKLTTNVNKSCSAWNGGIVNLLLSAAPQCGSQGSNGGVKAGCRNEEDGFVGEGRRKGDLKPWTLIGGDEAWMSLWWHSAPDICLALNNTLDRAGEWWPPGRLTLQPVPRWATSGHFLSLRLPLHLSTSLSFCLWPVNTHPLVWWVLLRSLQLTCFCLYFHQQSF